MIAYSLRQLDGGVHEHTRFADSHQRVLISYYYFCSLLVLALIRVRSDEVVEVRVEELPEDAHDILDILMAELAPLDLWLRFAVCPSWLEVLSLIECFRLNISSTAKSTSLNKF